MLEWKKILLSSEDTIEFSIGVLHEGGCRIALIVDKNMKLLGTVTDGDIRRALINKTSMTSSVGLIMNSKPIVGAISDSRNDILNVMSSKDLLHMPIVDQNEVLCGLETLHNLIEGPKFDNPIFLMAGGFGKRLHPLTKDIPKPLLRLSGKPILENIIEQFKAYGFHNFFISTHYKSDQIKDYFKNGESYNVSIQYVHENSPLGTAGSLGLLQKKDLSDLPLIVMNADLLTKINFSELLNFHNSERCDATICVREHSYQVPYGVVKTNAQKIISIEEKPTYKFFVNAGIYVLNQKVLDDVDGVTYLDMPDLLEQKIKLSKVSLFPLHEYWLDIGQIEQFEKAQQDSQNLFK
jgi:dTDP-glucose pyrophosphorylase